MQSIIYPKFKRTICLWLMVAAPGLLGQPEDFEFEHISLKQGLSQTSAFSILQDSKCLIWTGTAEGFTNSRIHLGNQQQLSFTHLDPGEYILYVKGFNNDGVWNEEATPLKITILPPWLKTWWAYTLYVTLALGLLYGLRRYELNRQRLKHNLELEHVELEKYKELDRLKSRFFASLSHEFRTPLTLISGPLERWLPEIDQPEMRRDFEITHRNIHRLLRLVNQLLDISRLESGKMKLQTAPVNLVAFTRQLCMAFESLATCKQIQFTLNAPDEEITAYLDRDKYEKIINNLLSNAFKFTPESGKIEVAISLPTPMSPPRKGLSKLPSSEPACRNSSGRGLGVGGSDASAARFLEIIIRDTGPGISPAHLPHIFDRFYQVDDSTVREQGGTGIGLALTKELVELHHGKITVESEPGKGTTFTVRLPLGKKHLKPVQISDLGFGTSDNTRISAAVAQLPEPKYETVEETVSADASPLPNRQAGEIVLIVEDHPDMHAYITGHLQQQYRIIEAEDGEKGLKQAQKHSPHLIVSDVMMPKMDGYRFCEKIKTDARTSHIPVILLTAKASRDSKLEGLETGADDYLTKPFDAAELQVRIKNLIEQRRHLRELFQRNLKVEPRDITVTSMDEKLLSRAIEIVEENIDNTEFDTAVLAKEVGMSRGHLNAKLQALTGHSSREFIRTLRLKRAAHLLQNGYGNVTEVAYEVGFNSLSHFAKVFKEQFGVLPAKFSSDYLSNMCSK